MRERQSDQVLIIPKSTNQTEISCWGTGQQWDSVSMQIIRDLILPAPSGGAIFMGYGGTCVASCPPSRHGHVWGMRSWLQANFMKRESSSWLKLSSAAQKYSTWVSVSMRPTWYMVWACRQRTICKLHTGLFHKLLLSVWTSFTSSDRCKLSQSV